MTASKNTEMEGAFGLVALTDFPPIQYSCFFVPCMVEVSLNIAFFILEEFFLNRDTK